MLVVTGVDAALRVGLESVGGSFFPEVRHRRRDLLSGTERSRRYAVGTLNRWRLDSGQS